VSKPTLRNIWRFYSTNAVGALVAWNMMPSVLEIYIPWPWHAVISAVLFASFIIARLIPQPKLESDDVG